MDFTLYKDGTEIHKYNIDYLARINLIAAGKIFLIIKIFNNTFVYTAKSSILRVMICIMDYIGFNIRN